MAIVYKVGNIFDSNCQTLVNTVNCQGVMGKGLALQFKRLFPTMYIEYIKACKCGDINKGGDLWLYNLKFIPTHQLSLLNLAPPIHQTEKILCFATKEHWKNKSDYNWIRRGLQTFRDKYKEWGITSIAFPKLGCTNGGLNWGLVKIQMEEALNDLDIPVEIWVENKSEVPVHSIQVVTNTKDLII